MPRYSRRSRLVVTAVAVAVCLLACEAILRVMSRRDPMGSIHIGSTIVKPYRLSPEFVAEEIAQYRRASNSKLIYDSELGWSPRPGLPPHNAHGFLSIRRVVEPARPPDRLRIALAGSSYTRGAEAFGWWRVLEHDLNMNDIPAEVLNFGVNGYGMDQIYLRWKRDIAGFHPHVVVFCFTAGISLNDLNVIRQLRDPETGIPFTKPRFLLDGDGLRLVNSPTPPPEAVPGILRDVAASPLLPFERFWVPDNFQPRWWRSSRVLALVEAKTGHSGAEAPERDMYRMNSENIQLALRIIRRFRDEVEASGSHFVIAHMPHHADLTEMQRTGRFAFDDFYRALHEMAPVISTEAALLAACGGKPILRSFENGHYNAELESVVGSDMAAWMRVHAPEMQQPIGMR